MIGAVTRTLDRLLTRRSDDAPLLQWARGSLVSVAGTTGRIVTEQTALSVPPVYACTRILAEALATMDLDLYRRTEKGKVKDLEQPLYWILHDLPNPEVTSYELRLALMAHLILWGNAYAEIQRDAAGRVIGLWPLLPNRMERIDRSKEGRLRYWYRLPTGDLVILMGPFPGLTSDILHLRGVAFDAIRGYSPMRLLRESVGLTQGLAEYGSRWFGNDATPGGVIQAKGRLTQDQIDSFKGRWEEAHRGMTQAHRVAVLEDGWTFNAVTRSPQESQFLESRTFQLRETAMMFRISPHLLQDLERATFANIEHLGIEFVRVTMQPWMVNWQQALARDVIGVKDIERSFCEFDPSKLLQGDLRSMIAAFSQGIQWGVYSANDVRAKLGDNPRDDGDRYLTPMNMQAGNPAATAPAETPAPLADVQQQPAAPGVPADAGTPVVM